MDIEVSPVLTPGFAFFSRAFSPPHQALSCLDLLRQGWEVDFIILTSSIGWRSQTLSWEDCVVRSLIALRRESTSKWNNKGAYWRNEFRCAALRNHTGQSCLNGLHGHDPEILVGHGSLKGVVIWIPVCIWVSRMRSEEQNGQRDEQKSVSDFAWLFPTWGKWRWGTTFVRGTNYSVKGQP